MNITDETCLVLAIMCGKPVEIVRDSNTGRTTIKTLGQRVNYDALNQVFRVQFSDSSFAVVPLSKFKLEAESRLKELRKALVV